MTYPFTNIGALLFRWDASFMFFFALIIKKFFF